LQNVTEEAAGDLIRAAEPTNDDRAVIHAACVEHVIARIAIRPLNGGFPHINIDSQRRLDADAVKARTADDGGVEAVNEQPIITIAAIQQVCVLTACQDIIAVLAEQLVIANAARDDVIPGAAMQLIRRAVAEDAVVKVGADNVFDGVQLADDTHAPVVTVVP